MSKSKCLKKSEARLSEFSRASSFPCFFRHNHKTKKDAVTAALKEYVQHRKQLEILELAGTVEFDRDYDYKAARRRKR
jgi:hypothetical protein